MADENKKKSLKEQLEEFDFKSIGGLNIFDTPVSPSSALKRIEEGREKEKIKQATDEAIELYPKGSKGFAEATKDKTILENAEENNEVSLGESVSNAIISGAIKFPYGWAQLTADIKDAIGDDVPLEETNLAKLDAWFDSTVMGELMNYSEEKIPFTRIHEPKHLHPEVKYNNDKTLIIKEYSKKDNGSNPYYPINDLKNQNLVLKYREKVSENKNLFICGRLGDYKYYDMDKTIEMALSTFQKFDEKRK